MIIMDDVKSTDDKPNYETTDAQIRPLVYTGIVLLVLMFGSFIGIIPLFKILDYYQPLLDDKVAPLVDQRIGIDNNAPRLQIDPPRQKFELAAQEDKILNNYAWVDPNLKIVRIPIDRAIELVSEGALVLPHISTNKKTHQVTLP
jgi:hypothetical protein